MLLVIVPSTSTKFARQWNEEDLEDLLSQEAADLETSLEEDLFGETAIAPTSNGTLAQSCYTSKAKCEGATSCNGRGSCVLKLTSGNGECWGCKCANGFAGVECQKNDYSMLVSSAVLC